ncbi:MAG: gamma-glutamyltransferase [Micavibrio sp.]|nr:gamma-glutamyltransferase [Micavibrio sp.]
MKHLYLLAILLSLVFFSGITVAQDFRPVPEIASEIVPKQSIMAQKYVAVTANPLATKAAYDVLKQGGSALDAAIAAQAILGLVEPQSSGLGGGAFLVYYDKAKNKITTLDGREISPKTIKPNVFEGKDFYKAVLSADSVGVPGTPALLAEMYERSSSQIPLIDLLQPAIDLAEAGFEVSPRLQGAIDNEIKNNRVSADFTNYFTGDAVIKNPAYAQTLSYLADYRTVPQQTLAERLKAIGSEITEADLNEYKVIEREPICGFYRGYKICSMDEPSSGGITILQILGMIENFPIQHWGGDDVRSWHVIAEASRLAFKDRNHYIADPDFIESKKAKLIDKAYLKDRASLINVTKRNDNVTVGDPDKEGGTSHISIVDAQGNIVSMTTTIESAFGSHYMVDGYFLNNELTDFSFETVDENGKLIANRVEGRKRPRSSMAPTIVFDPMGKPFMVLGSAGGSRIIGYVVQRIIAAIDWGLPLKTSLDMPNILSRGEEMEVENGFQGALLEQLVKKGHQVVVGEQNSGLTAIQFIGNGMQSYADPRREGVALGE